jgi:protein-tyrosine phosphatase
MDHNNVRNLGRIIGPDREGKVSLLLDYAGRHGETIADPWYTGKFSLTYRDILEGCEGFLKFLSRKNGKEISEGKSTRGNSRKMPENFEG